MQILMLFSPLFSSGDGLVAAYLQIVYTETALQLLLTDMDVTSEPADPANAGAMGPKLWHYLFFH